ncbi:hypothetical protein AAE478_006661 [Parahypoxylon ruwenzoriense]
MAPSLLKTVGAAAVAFAAQAGATKSYKVSEIYDSTNFFDKFDFFTGTDPNGGYVQYQSQTSANNLGLVKYQDGEVYIGVDHTSGNYDPNGAGRKSVRLESKNVYNHGLVIADFSHLPKPVCGSWPAFWFFGEPWPTKGEIDIYENWNDLTFNRHTAHVDDPSVVGECTITSDGMTATIDSPNCYDHAEGQWAFQGCSASEFSSTFGSASGGIYAMEWTDDYLKIWDWPRAAAPADVLSGNPVPSLLWGVPSYVIKQCNINKAFRDMKMVLNVDFCAVAGQADKWDASCKAKTGYSSCVQYVAEKHDDFALANFKIKDIKVYQLVESVPSTTSSTVSASSSTSSTSTISTTSSIISTTSSIVSTTSSYSSETSSSSYAVISSTSSASVASSYIVSSSSAVSATTTSTASYTTASSTASDDDDSCTDDDEATSSSYAVSSTGSVSATATDSLSSSLVTSSGYSVSASATATSSYGTITSSSDEPEMTTSTIYTTSIYTITSCAATVTNCPAGNYVTTEIISIGTTVCPVTATVSQPQPTTTTTSTAAPGGYTTRTIEVTKTYTITSCKPTVTNCPVGSVTTEVSVTTTVCPIENATPSSSSGSSSIPSSSISKPAGNTGIVSKPETEGTTTVKQVASTTSAVYVYVSATNLPLKPSEISGGNSETDVAVTAAVVPVTSANTNYYANATLTSVTLSISTGSAGAVGGGCKGAGCGIVEVGGSTKTGVNFVLGGVSALFFFFAM